MDIVTFSMLLLVLAFLPPAIGYCRRLDDWTMINIWLWLALPVLGWLIALVIAVEERPGRDGDRPR